MQPISLITHGRKMEEANNNTGADPVGDSG
jgi:hypothetical protein